MKHKQKGRQKMADQIKFLFNGIKLDGKLVKGFYSKGNYNNGAVGCFYAHGWFKGQAELLRKYFNVNNDSDIMTDYFEEDKIYFFPGDKYLDELDKAMEQSQIRQDKRAIKRYEQMRDKNPIRFEYCRDEYERLINKYTA